MKPLTPMDARRSLDYAEKHDTHLAVGHRRALETIAGMREEWGMAYRLDNENKKRVMWGWNTREDAEQSVKLLTRAYIYGPVCRYVTNEEEA